RRLKVILSRYTPEKAEQASGVRAQDIVRIAREFAETKPATVISMRGISSHLNGVYAERAIMLLPAITGNIDVLGGYCVPRMARLGEPSPIPPEPTRTSGVARREDLTLAVHTISQEVFQLIKQKKQRVGVYMTYVHNPAYSGPEADLVESVLKDESLVPFFVSVDAFLSETTSLADLILPDALYLERWDPETQPALELVPYVGLRQPVLPPMGEARPFREVAYDLAHRIGGGMEKYFQYGSPENYIKWAISDIEGLKTVGGLEYLKKYGVWTDRTAKPLYKLHEQELDPSELAGSRILRDGVIVKKDPETGVEAPIGVRVKGKSRRGFPTPSRKFEAYSSRLLNARTLSRSNHHKEVYTIGSRIGRHFPHPYYEPIWEHSHLEPNEFILVTYKPNVQTNSSTANCKWLSEIHHSNPMWVHEDSARALGIRNGDFVEVSSKVGKIVTQALVMQGIHPRVVAISTGVGRWAYGRIAQGKPFQSADPDTRHIWWEEEGKGVHPNPIIPVSTDPIGGGQAFMDTVVALRPLRRGDLRQEFRREGW
ncbi:MAG: molybdopterin-dependent oxidoreductase, partial [Armatimonadetes bacterium]|nr:molybdopterin-dependent oxidoreductase [Armatimonadota bacterium]